MSLGVSPILSKTCNYRCVYCQLGRTTHFTNTRQEFFPCNAIFEELQASLHKIDKLDYITFVGEGDILDAAWFSEDRVVDLQVFLQ